MKKAHKVVMIATEKEGIMYINMNSGNLIFKPETFWNKTKTLTGLQHRQPYHLHIISDEKIQNGDWCILLDSFGNVFLGEPQQYLATKDQVLNNGLRKVIASTNKFITPNSWIPNSFVQAYMNAYNNGKPIIEVNLEMSHMPELTNSLPHKVRADGSIIIHQSKLITTDEMYLNMQYYMEYCQSKGYVTPHEWIEEHKHF